MAVYTKITRDELEEFLSDYDDLGTLQSFEGIMQGVENTNYHIFTDAGRYILTLFEKRTDPADLPYFMALIDFLAGKGICCPHAYLDSEKFPVGTLADKPAVITSWLPGESVPEQALTADHCREAGALAARLHEAGKDFHMRRNNTMGLTAWRELAEKTEDRADEIAPGLGALIAEELVFQTRQNFEALPRGVIHADLFPDNVFFDDDGQVSGVIDFYFACSGYYAYDLALVINAWCFDETGRLRPRHLKALLEGYKSVRALSQEEIAALSIFCRAAALRILLTRLHDMLFHDEGSLVAPKDPEAYIDILHYHRQIEMSFS